MHVTVNAISKLTYKLAHKVACKLDVKNKNDIFIISSCVKNKTKQDNIKNIIFHFFFCQKVMKKQNKTK